MQLIREHVRKRMLLAKTPAETQPSAARHTKHPPIPERNINGRHSPMASNNLNNMARPMIDDKLWTRNQIKV